VGLGLVVRLVLARNFTTTQYGLYYLAMTVTNFVALISTLGLHLGATRQIAFARGINDTQSIKASVVASVIIAIGFGVIVAGITVGMAPIIANNIFGIPEVEPLIRILGVSIPFFSVITILTSIYMGFEKVLPGVIFQHILYNPLILLLLLPVVLLDLHFNNTAWSCTLSVVIGAIAFVRFFKVSPPINLSNTVGVSKALKVLLLMALPLFALEVSDNIMIWADTLFIGSYMTAHDVGLYQSAIPVARFIPIVLTLMYFVYVPLTTKLVAENDIATLKMVHRAVTKWVSIVAIPLFLACMLFPEIIIETLFGIEYIPATLSLQILSVGYLALVILGPNGETIVALGNTKYLMISGLVFLGVNIGLNILLIPILGINGAAIATGVSRLGMAVTWAIKVFSGLHLNPYTWDYIRPTIIIIAIILLISQYIHSLFDIVLMLIAVVLIYIAISIVTNNTNDADKIIINKIKEIVQKGGN